MLVAFTLSMPGVNSCNGQWSGAGRCYAIVKSFTGKRAEAIKDTIVYKGYFTHTFSDGWMAAVTVEEVNRSAAAKLRRNSVGFNGYDWMVRDIIELGRIRTQEELHPKVTDKPEEPKCSE